MPNFETLLNNAAKNNTPWEHYDFTGFLTEQDIKYFTDFHSKHFPTRYVKDVKGNRMTHVFSNEESHLVSSIYSFFTNKKNFLSLIPNIDPAVLSAYFTLKLNFDQSIKIVRHDDYTHGKIFTIVIGLDSHGDGTELRDSCGNYVLTKELNPGCGYYFHPKKGITIHSVGMEKESTTDRLTLMANYFAVNEANYDVITRAFRDIIINKKGLRVI